MEIYKFRKNENIYGILMKLDFNQIKSKNYEKIFELEKDNFNWDLSVYVKWKKRLDSFSYKKIFC